MRRWIWGAAGVLALAATVVWWLWQSGTVEAEPAAAGTAAAAGPQADDAGASGSAVLDQGKQKYIWDAEHVTFKIEHYVGKPLVDALRRGDAAALRGFLREGFRGGVPGGKPVERRVGVVVEEHRSGKRRDLAADEFVRHLTDVVGPIRDFGGARLRVLTIDRIGDDEGHWGVGLLLAVRGTTADGAHRTYLAEGSGTVRFAELADIDAGRVMETIVWNQETVVRSPALMEEVTERYGLTGLGLLDNWDLDPAGYRSWRYQPAVADFDRDGWLDLVIASIDGRPRLLRSIGGQRFADVTARSGLLLSDPAPVRWAINALACWIDYDDDSYPDLLLAERLYHNEGGGRFRDVSGATGMQFDRVPMGCAVMDYDLDGRSDLYIAYQKGFRQQATTGPRPWVDDSESGAPNHLWRNEGGGRFRDVTVEAGAGAGFGQTFAAATFYYDDDLHPDLYTANDFGRNVLLRNRGDGTFEDVTAATATGDFATSMGVAAGDLDNDGSTEIYVANMYSKMGRRIIAHVGDDDYPAGVYRQIVGSCAGNRLYTIAGSSSRGGAGRYEEVGYGAGVNEVGWAFAPALADLDGNGLLDIYSTTGYMSFDRGEPDG